jgi:hypothetical protein
MGITLSMTGGVPGNRSVLLFYPEGRTYSPPAKQAVVSLPPVGPCALHEASAGCFSRGGSQCRRACGLRSSLPVRLADGCRRICIFAANRCPHPGQPVTRLRKPATGSFIAEMDDAIPHRPFSFACAKRNKTPPCGEQKGRDLLWRSIIWRLKS